MYQYAYCRHVHQFTPSVPASRWDLQLLSTSLETSKPELARGYLLLTSESALNVNIDLVSVTLPVCVLVAIWLWWEISLQYSSHMGKRRGHPHLRHILTIWRCIPFYSPHMQQVSIWGIFIRQYHVRPLQDSQTGHVTT